MEELNKYEKLRQAVGGFKKSSWIEDTKKSLVEEGWRRKSQRIALRILLTLRSKKMSQSELANILGVSPQQVNKWVKGSENFTIETLEKIGTALDLNFIEADNTSMPVFERRESVRLKSTTDNTRKSFHVALKKKLTINSLNTDRYASHYESIGIAAEPSEVYGTKTDKSIAPNNIHFSLASVEIDHFFVSKNVDPTDQDLSIDFAFQFSVLKDLKAIGCTMNYQLTAPEHPLIEIEVTCLFAIDTKNWNQLKPKTKLTIPSGFARHIGVITSGITSGILYVKTENTIFKNYPMQLISLEEALPEDITLEI